MIICLCVIYMAYFGFIFISVPCIGRLFNWSFLAVSWTFVFNPMYPTYVHLPYCFTYLICMYTYRILIQLYCNQIWSCLRLTLYRRPYLLLCTCLVSLYSALSKNTSLLIPLQSTYVSTVPHHSSYLRTIISIPCRYQFISYVISRRATTVCTSRLSLTSPAV